MEIKKPNQSAEDVIIAHESIAEISKTIAISPKLIRPCIARMFCTPFQKGVYPDRSLGASILASELIKMGVDEEIAFSHLTKWNQSNEPPMAVSELNASIRTAYRKEYNYSCRHPVLAGFCVGEDMCAHRKEILPGSRKYYNNRDFYRYRWQLLLRNARVLVYQGLIELERRRGVGAGGVIVANHKQVAFVAGITPKYVGSALCELRDVGLIKYQPGSPRKWEGKASEVRRVLPIPRPTAAQLRKLPTWTNDHE